MAKRTYEFDILANINAALASINDLTSKSQKQLDKISFNTAVSAIKDGFEVISGVAEHAFHSIEGFAEKAIELSLESAKANEEMANALRISGDYSEAASRQFESLARAIASTTNYSDDAVKGAVSIAKQYRLTNAEAEKTIKVAADLAAVQGISLAEATTKVSQTFNGFVDKSLARVIPALKNLTQESLISGNAVELIGQRVKGSAEVLGQTFSGAVTRAGEAADDIYKSLGNLITQNPAIIAGINELAKGFREFNAEIGANKDSFQKVVTDGFLLFINAAPSVISAIQKTVSVLETLYFNATRAALVIAQGPTSILQALTGNNEYIDDLSARLDKLRSNFDESSKSTDAFFTPLIAKTQEIVDRINKVTEAAKKSTAEVKNLGASNTGKQARIDDIFNGEKLKARIAEIAKEPITFTIDAMIKAHDITAKEGIAIGVGLVANITKGADGAKKLLTETIGAAANAILPGIGGAVGEIVGLLSQGPEEVKKQVTAFADAIPDLIAALADSLPVLIETLVEKLPPALAKAMPTVAIGFTTSLVAHIPDIVKGFITGLTEAAKSFVNALIDAIPGGSTLTGDSKPFSSNGGSTAGRIGADVLTVGLNELTGNAVGNFIDDIFGFANGGRTNDDPKLAGDRGLVKIGPGEQTFNRDLTSRLENYLDKNEGGGSVVIQNRIILGTKELSIGMLEVSRSGRRTA